MKPSTSSPRRSRAAGFLALAMLATLFSAGGAGAAANRGYSVTTTADADDGSCSVGHCTLREAIIAANKRLGSDTVRFAIPGALPATIHLATSLPPVRDPVRIDGTTQPGYGGTPPIIVDGTAVPNPVDGLRILNGPTILRGLVMTGFGDDGFSVESANPVTIDRNRIAGNGGNGITVVSSSALILDNEIDGNGGLAIDLADNGITANDPGDADAGPSRLQNFPILSAVEQGISSTVVRGVLSSAANKSYLVQLFRNASCDPSGNGEAASILASFTVTTNGAGTGAFQRSVPGSVPPGSLVTATATDPAGNTSELSRCSPPSVAVPPNLVLVLTDDQSIDSIPRSPATMPWLQGRINDPADSWIRFTNAITNVSLCCPSRATTFTGQYAHNHGVNDNAQGEDLAHGSTIATWLDDAGYRTGLFGKYLNQYPSFGGNGAPFVPPGWDEWVAFVGGPEYGSGDYTIFEGDKAAPNPYEPAVYSTDFLAGKAQDFLTGATPGSPFFLEVAFNAPHWPFNPLPPGRTFPDFGNVAAPNFNEANVNDKPQWVRNLPLATPNQITTLNTAHTNEFRALLAVDEAIHGIVDTLSARGVLDNTVIVVTSDNGAAYGEHRWRNTESGGDLPRKACPYDICTHVPLLIRYPGAERRSEPKVVSNVDLAPTLADLAGVTPDAPVTFDGVSLVPLLAGPAPGQWREGALIEWIGPQFVPGYWAVRTERYLYVEYRNTGERELYDYEVDPWEETNLCPDPNLGDSVGAYACDPSYQDEQITLQALLESLKP